VGSVPSTTDRNGQLVATLDDVTVTFPKAGVAVVAFAGDHDVLTRAAVSELLESLLDEAQFVDSSMLSTFLAAHRSAGTLGKRFRIQLGTDSLVRRAFEVCGVLEVLDWASSREEALDGHGSQR
jgi:anti-anti-sigma regulatory factor